MFFFYKFLDSHHIECIADGMLTEMQSLSLVLVSRPLKTRILWSWYWHLWSWYWRFGLGCFQDWSV